MNIHMNDIKRQLNYIFDGIIILWSLIQLNQWTLNAKYLNITFQLDILVILYLL